MHVPYCLIFTEQVEFDASGKAIGVTSEGETAKCKKVVCDPSYLPNKVQQSNFIRLFRLFNFSHGLNGKLR